MLILRVVALRPIHGYAIVQRIQQLSKDALQIRQGSLYRSFLRISAPPSPAAIPTVDSGAISRAG